MGDPEFSTLREMRKLFDQQVTSQYGQDTLKAYHAFLDKLNENTEVHQVYEDISFLANDPEIIKLVKQSVTSDSTWVRSNGKAMKNGKHVAHYSHQINASGPFYEFIKNAEQLHPEFKKYRVLLEDACNITPSIAAGAHHIFKKMDLNDPVVSVVVANTYVGLAVGSTELNGE